MSSNKEINTMVIAFESGESYTRSIVIKELKQFEERSGRKIGGEEGGRIHS